jgi:pseudouridine kinase
MGKPYILVFGASVVDIFGFCFKDYKTHDSNPGSVKVSFGGVSRNIAENMARLGVYTKFISVIGDDEKGRRMLDHSQMIGYDMSESLIVKNGRTPTYLAILDEGGEMVSAIADMETADEINKEFIDSKAVAIEGADYTFVDADNPEILEYMLTKFKGKTNFILDPISAAKAKTITHLIKHFHSIKPNRQEAEVMVGFKIENDEDLVKAGDKLLSFGIKNVFISLDEDGVYFTNGVRSGKVKANNVPVKNVTGAGDSFVAGLGYGYHNELDILETLKMAVAMSVITIGSEKTINPDMCYDMVMKKIDEIDWEINKFS